MYKLFQTLFLAAIYVLNSGCTHMQLRYNHVNQAKTLTGIYEKQVLDNLAMFTLNQEALPFFAVPAAGSTDVTDSGALSASPLNGPAHTILALSSLSRGNKEGWTITPISDPSRLSLMRCAYRRAIGMTNPSDVCINCCEKQMKWKASKNTSICCDCCAIFPLKIQACSKRLVHNPCEKVGSYCNTHIRVCPESYDDFTRLVLTILDYAVNKPAATLQAEVTHYHYERDANGNLIPDGNGGFVIKYIDKFQANAHPFETTDAAGNPVSIIPTGSGSSSWTDPNTTGNLLDEAIRQRTRATLFPE